MTEREPKVSELLMATFGGPGSWTWWKVGERQSGPLPPASDPEPWREDLTHTAADMASDTYRPTKRGKAA